MTSRENSDGCLYLQHGPGKKPSMQKFEIIFVGKSILYRTHDKLLPIYITSLPATRTIHTYDTTTSTTAVTSIIIYDPHRNRRHGATNHYNYCDATHRTCIIMCLMVNVQQRRQGLIHVGLCNQPIQSTARACVEACHTHMGLMVPWYVACRFTSAFPFIALAALAGPGVMLLVLPMGRGVTPPPLPVARYAAKELGLGDLVPSWV